MIQYNIIETYGNDTFQVKDILPILYEKYNKQKNKPLCYNEIKDFIILKCIDFNNKKEINMQITENIDIITELFIKYMEEINRINIVKEKNGVMTYWETFYNEMKTLLLVNLNKIINNDDCFNFNENNSSVCKKELIFYDLNFTYLNDLRLKIDLFDKFKEDWKSQISYYIDKNNDNFPTLSVSLPLNERYNNDNELVGTLLYHALHDGDAVGEWQRRGARVNYDRHFVYQNDKSLISMSEEDRKIWLKNTQVLFSGKGGTVVIPLKNDKNANERKD